MNNASKHRHPQSRDFGRSSWLPTVGIALCIVLLCALSAGIKIRNTTALPYYDPNNGDNFYWTESAFQFRVATMVSETGSVPNVDQRVQYPEGIDLRRYHTSLMERVHGHVHRLFFPNIPLHQYLTYGIAGLSSLSVIAAFLAASAVWQNRIAGLVAAAVYTLAPASLARVTGQFLYEDFALPFLFGGFACLFIGFRRESVLSIVAGIVLFLVSILAWHMGEFLLLLLLIGFCGLVILYDRKVLPWKTIAGVTGGLLIAALCAPVLRAKFFALSMTMMVAYSLVIAILTIPRQASALRRTGIVAGLVGGAVLAAYGIAQLTHTQTHVFSVLLAKLRFAGNLPDDPSLMAFEARNLWTSSFVSPELAEIAQMQGAALVLGCVGLVWAGVRRARDPGLLLFVYLAAASFALYLLFTRLSVVAVFFLAIAAGGTWLISTQAGLTEDMRWKRTLRILSALIILTALTVELVRHSDLRFSIARPPWSQVNALTEWIEGNTDPDDPILAAYELSPSVATYANRPILLHSKWESPEIRAKVERFYTSLFEPEGTFADLAEQNGAQFFIHQSDWIQPGPDRFLYRAGFRSLSSDAALFKFHFAPETLTRFTLIHEIENYRIFEVRSPTENERSEISRRRIKPINKLSLFSGDAATPDTVTQEELMSGMSRVAAIHELENQARAAVARGDLLQLVDKYSSIVQLDSTDAMIWASLAAVYVELGDIEKSGAALASAIRLDPALAPDADRDWPFQALLANGIAYIALQDAKTAEFFFRRALQREDSHWRALLGQGQALLLQSRMPEAREAIARALEQNPDSPLAHEVLGMWYAFSNEFGPAIDAVRRSLELDPNQPKLHTVIRYLESRMQASEPGRPGNAPTHSSP